jgi:hypothetical protein
MAEPPLFVLPQTSARQLDADAGSVPATKMPEGGWAIDLFLCAKLLIVSRVHTPSPASLVTGYQTLLRTIEDALLETRSPRICGMTH